MINQVIVEIIVRRILNSGINPVTGQPFQLDDIKIPEYKTAVENEILMREGII